MNFKYDEEEGITEVVAEVEDVCLMCANFDDCPLIQALSINLVYPSASNLTIEQCPLYVMEELS